MATETDKAEPEVVAEVEPAEKPEAEEQPEADTIPVSRATLEKLVAELQGHRKAQDGRVKREKGYQDTIQSMQVLTKFNELPQEEQEGATNLAKFSRTLAVAEGKARGLTDSDVRYLATLPWTHIAEEAGRIGETQGKGGGGSVDDLAALFGEAAARKGSADVRVPDTRGRAAGPASATFKNLNAALDAAMRLPPDKARELLAKHGINL